MSKIIEALKQDRASKGLTQKQYAKSVGYDSATAVSLWESGKREVPNSVIEMLLGKELPLFTKCSDCGGTGLIKEANHE